MDSEKIILDTPASKHDPLVILKSIQKNSPYRELRKRIETLMEFAICFVLIRAAYQVIVSYSVVASLPKFAKTSGFPDPTITPVSILVGEIAYIILWILIILTLRGLSLAFLDMVDAAIFRHGYDKH